MESGLSHVHQGQSFPACVHACSLAFVSLSDTPPPKNNIDRILKHLSERSTVNVSDFSVHDIACGNEITIYQLLHSIRAWHKEVHRKRTRSKHLKQREREE